MNILNDRAEWLHAGSSICSHPPVRPKRTLRFAILGAPGVGKGTQAELLCHKTHICHLATGDIFRAARTVPRENLTPAIAEAVEFMHKGLLVPDRTVLSLVKERLNCFHCNGGFLLDGFPRTVPQALALEKILAQEGLALDAVIDYELPLEEVVERFTGRRTCSSCGMSFHVTANPSKKSGICDECGAALMTRDDDNPETVRTRLQAYHDSTEPLIEFYEKRGLLYSISAAGTPAQVHARTMKAIQSFIF